MRPEPRPPSFPAKFLLRARQSLRITFAPPIDTRHIARVLTSANPSDSSLRLHPSVEKDKQDSGDMREPLAVSGLDYGAYGEAPAKRWVDAALTAEI